MTRHIIHLDLDAFYCAVEVLHNPDLKGKPFAVGGRPEERGVVASCSYPARRRGVHSAMPMSRALRLCPGLIVIPSRHGVYSQVSRQVMERLYRLTPLVEKVSIDEAFLDVSQIPEAVESIASRLQASINTELNLPCSLGVASNKLLAKIANDVGKAAALSQSSAAGEDAPPNAITVVPHGEEAGFLAPLPANRLWGVGPKTAARLAEIGIHTIGDLADYDPGELRRLFGKNGHDLSSHARGIDDSPIVTHHEPKSYSQEVTFARDVSDEQRLRRTLHEMTEQLGQYLRESGYTGATVKLKIRWPDFTTLTRQMTLAVPTNKDSYILAAALTLFEKVWSRGKAVRLIGVGITGLSLRAQQLDLFEMEKETEQKQDETEISK